MHEQTSGNDVNYIISGTGKAICDGFEEELKAGVCYVCPKGHLHSIVNTGDEDLVIFTLVHNI
ncbi:MAG: cupin domain-containing protein [Ruminococcus flavefaciens]|nr:cupin domain-containing protein [Ruminococcus flavefaciens]